MQHLKTLRDLRIIFGKSRQGTVIQFSGAFDLFNLGHARLIHKTLDLLRGPDMDPRHIVFTINSDASLKRLKGDHRPICSELERAEMLRLCCRGGKYIYTYIFDEDTPVKACEAIQPDWYIKGNEYASDDKSLPELENIETNIVYINTGPDAPHTTSTIEHIIQLHNKGLL